MSHEEWEALPPKQRVHEVARLVGWEYDTVAGWNLFGNDHFKAGPEEFKKRMMDTLRGLMLELEWGEMSSLAALLLILSGVNTRMTEAREASIIQEVAQAHAFDSQWTLMLAAVRREENGGPGLECGVGSDGFNQRARRFAGSPEASLRLQLSYVAGTMERRLPTNRYLTADDVFRFGIVWCPKNFESWADHVSGFMLKGAKEE